MRSRAEVMHDDIVQQPLPRQRERTPYRDVFDLPQVPPDWCSYVAYLLQQTEMSPDDARDLRGWMGWRTLPRRFWVRVQAIAAKTTAAPYEDWAG